MKKEKIVHKIFDKNGNFMFECKNLGGYLENISEFSEDKIIMKEICLRDYDLTGSCIFDFDFSFSEIVNVNFYWSLLVNCKFTGSLINNCIFSGSSIKDCDFSDCNLDESDFGIGGLGQPTKLTNVDFSNSVFGTANFNGVCFDEHTKWPSGFHRISGQNSDGSTILDKKWP